MSINVPPGGFSEYPYRPGGGSARPQPKPQAPAWGGEPQAWPWGGPPGESQPTPPQSGGRGRRRATIAVALTAVITTLIGGGAFAFYRMDPFHVFRPGPQPAQAVPANALAYVSVDLDPMAQQKISAMRFLGAFPAYAESTGSPSPTEDLRRVYFDAMMHEDHCRAFDYDRDVAPWIGDRLGVAVMPPTSRDKTPIEIVMQVSDEAAAHRGVAVLNTCDASAGQGTSGVAFSRGFMIVTKHQYQATAYAKAAEQASLADNATFNADMDSLGDPGVVSAWANVKGLFGAFLPRDLAGDSTMRTALTQSQRVAATFRFRSDAVEIASSVYGANSSVVHGYNPVTRLPDTTVLAVSESGGNQRVSRAWNRMTAQLRARDPEIDRQIDVVQRETGLRLPDDLRTVFGQNLMFAVDKRGLNLASILDRGPGAGTNLGVRFTNNPAKLNNLYNRIMTLAGGGGLDLPGVSKKTFPDGIAIASNPRYATTLGTLDGNLGDSATFRSVCPDAASAESVIYLNIDDIKAQLLAQLRKAGVPADVIANLRPLRAFGITQNVVGKYAHTTIRVSIHN